MLNKTVFTIFFWAISLAGFSHKASHFEFVPNKGQFHQNVKYRVNLPSGHLFIENKSLTYLFFDESKLINYHNRNESLTPNSKIQHYAFQVNWINSNPNPVFSETENYSYYFNYFIGKIKAPKIYPAKALYIKNLYEGIDVKWMDNEGQLKYEYHVAPGADPNIILQQVHGTKVQLKNNELVYETTLGNFIEEQPFAYQKINGKIEPVSCKFKVKNNTIGFQLGDYDKNIPLVIDPTLIFSTYSGSTSNNFGYTATFDSEGFLYSGSTVFGASGTYPTTLGAFQTSFKGGTGASGGTDIGISKFSQNGTNLVYSTFIGGGSDEIPHSLYVNTRDELYVFGTSGSSNYPVTFNAFDTTFNLGGSQVDLLMNNGLGVNYPFSCDLIVTRFSNDGSQILASTYIGGSENDGINNINNLRYNYADEVRGEIEIDSEDNVYIATCTQSNDFPIVGNTFQPNKGANQDGVIIKLNTDLSQILWSSYYGGDNNDALYSLSITSSGDIYVAGGTNSTDIPAFSNFLFSVFVGGRTDGYVGRISADGTTLMESSYLGTVEYDQVYFVELDKNENVYLMGQTESQGFSFIVNIDPDSANYVNLNAGQFIMKFNPELDSIWWSTRFGTDDLSRPKANPNISPTAFLVDLCNSIYLSGWGGASNIGGFLNNEATTVDSMLITNATAQQTTTDGNDFYLFVLSDDAQQVNYASYFGGNQSSEHVDGGTSRFDRKGKIYQAVCAGCGGFSDFPIFPSNALSSQNNANCNLGVFKIDFLLPLVVADFTVDEKGCVPFQVNINNNSLSQNATQYFWDFGDNTTAIDSIPQKTYTAPGRYTITLAVSDSNSCNLTDTITRVIFIQEDTTQLLPELTICLGDSVSSGLVNVPGYQYTWLNTQNVKDTSSANTLITATQPTTLTLLQNNGTCTDSVFIPLNIDSVNVSATPDTALCLPQEINLSGSSSNVKYFIWSTSVNLTDTLNFIIDSNYLASPASGTNKYYLHVINQNNCKGVDSTIIQIASLSLQTSKNQNICFNDSVWIGAQSTILNDSLTFNWLPTNFIVSPTDSSFILVSPIITTNFIVNTTNSFNCDATDSVRVIVSTLNPNNAQLTSSTDTVFLGKTVTLNALPKNLNYVWRFPNTVIGGSEISFAPNQNTSVELEISDPENNNCKVVLQKEIYVKEILCNEPEIFLPTGFSPNADLINDLWLPYGKNILNFKIDIYNRWGELVIGLNNSNPTWDGTFKGNNAPEAVYYFEADIECVDNQKFYKKGDITLTR